jgi:molybdopterin-guanine dinucleotide biosynthesis protein A
MGQDKTQMIVEEMTLAVRTAALLQRVVETAVEVGPGVSGLPTTLEDPPREGPLAAIATGAHWLRKRGHTGSTLVIACDLPRLTEPLLRFLVEFDAVGSVVPVVQGRPQPLCAKWCHRDLDGAGQFLALGVRSLRHLYDQPDIRLLDESQWLHVAREDDFFDIDTPADLQQFRLSS